MVKTVKKMVEQEVEVECCDFCGKEMDPKDGMKNLKFLCRDFPEVGWDGVIGASGPITLAFHYTCFCNKVIPFLKENCK